MYETNAVTGSSAGLTSDEQIRIALQSIIDNGGIAQMPDIYQAVEKRLNGLTLSPQGKASLRKLVNTTAVQAGYIYPHDPALPGWRATPEGKEFLGSESAPAEEVVNVDTQQKEVRPSNTAKGTAFEHYLLLLLKRMYPHYTWYHQGQHKTKERGLDLIGSQIGESLNHTQIIGVQVKLHSGNTAPSSEEWLKFLAGCFARRIDNAIFVTTGRLTSEQRREAGEAKVVVIEGRDEIRRIAGIYEIEDFEFFDDPTEV
jgi:hypothetical protein